MALSSLAVRRPVTTLMFYAGIALVGIISFSRLSVDFLPPVSIPRLTIHALCLDLSPEEIDERVAQPLASAAGSAHGVKRTSSVSRRGVAVVTVEFHWGTDMDYATLDVREKLDRLGSELPVQAGRPTILRADPTLDPVLTIAVTTSRLMGLMEGNPHILTELTQTAHALLKKRLEQVEGVAQVTVLGGVEREIRIDLREEKLLNLRLGIDEVAGAIGAESVQSPEGAIRKGSLRYPIRLTGGPRSAAEIGRMSLTGKASGRRIHLAEIATVHDTTREKTGWIRLNGREILVLQVRKEAGTNTLVVSANVRRTLEQLASENPNLRLNVLLDQAEFISASVADVEQSLVWGGALAFLVLFLFLQGIRDPLIVGLAMPVSILVALAAMDVLGIGLNVISLTGLALGIGMLGDNAIIVIENVRRLREQGAPRMEAILSGSREINLAVTASTMTNVAIFLPVLFVSGVAQQLFAGMAVAMTASLLASLLVAVTLVPMLLAQEKDGSVARSLSTLCQLPWLGPMRRRAAEMVQVWSQKLLDDLLPWALSRRRVVVLFTLAMLAASVLAATLIPAEQAPEIDRRRFIIDVTMDGGALPSSVTALRNA